MTGSASLEGCRPGRLGLALRGPLRGRLRVRKTGKLPRSRGATSAPELYGTVRKGASTHIKGRRSAERRVVRGRSALSQRCRWAGSRRAPLLANALAFRRSTAALADCSAQSGPALHGSVDVRYPGSELLADRPIHGTSDLAGRADFRTARGWSYEPHPGHRTCSINRPSPVDVPQEAIKLARASPTRTLFALRCFADCFAWLRRLAPRLIMP